MEGVSLFLLCGLSLFCDQTGKKYHKESLTPYKKDQLRKLRS